MKVIKHIKTIKTIKKLLKSLKTLKVLKHMAIQMHYIKNRMGSAPLKLSGKETTLNIFEALKGTKLGKQGGFKNIVDKENKISAAINVLKEKGVSSDLIGKLGKLDKIQSRKVATEIFNELREHIPGYSEQKFLHGIESAFTPEKVSETAKVKPKGRGFLRSLLFGRKQTPFDEKQGMINENLPSNQQRQSLPNEQIEHVFPRQSFTRIPEE